MKTSEKIKQLLNNETFCLFASSIIIFAGILASLPSASLLRTIPLLFVFSFFAFMICKKPFQTFAISFIASFFMHCVKGYTIYKSFIFSAMLIVIVVLAFFASKHFKAKKNVMFLLFCILGTVASLVFYGGPISYKKAESFNKEYLSKNYENISKPLYSYYSPFENAYLLIPEFFDGKFSHGHEKEYPIFKKDDIINDGIRDYIEENLLYECREVLSAILREVEDNFVIMQSDIILSNGEILSFDANAKDYFDRTNYVVEIYSLDTSKENFDSIISKLQNKLSEYSQYFSYNQMTVKLCSDGKAYHETTL